MLQFFLSFCKIHWSSISNKKKIFYFSQKKYQKKKKEMKKILNFLVKLKKNRCSKKCATILWRIPISILLSNNVKKNCKNFIRIFQNYKQKLFIRFNKKKFFFVLFLQIYFAFFAFCCHLKLKKKEGGKKQKKQNQWK